MLDLPAEGSKQILRIVQNTLLDVAGVRAERAQLSTDRVDERPPRTGTVGMWACCRGSGGDFAAIPLVVFANNGPPSKILYALNLAARLTEFQTFTRFRFLSDHTSASIDYLASACSRVGGWREPSF